MQAAPRCAPRPPPPGVGCLRGGCSRGGRTRGAADSVSAWSFLGEEPLRSSSRLFFFFLLSPTHRPVVGFQLSPKSLLQRGGGGGGRKKTKKSDLVFDVRLLPTRDGGVGRDRCEKQGLQRVVVVVVLEERMTEEREAGGFLALVSRHLGGWGES